MRQTLTRFLTIFALSCLWPALAHSSGSFLTCSSVFSSLLGHQEYFASIGIHESVESESVKTIRQVKNSRGTKLILLEKFGSAWGSEYASVENAFQGDPRRTIQLLGSKAASIVGFRMRSKNEMYAPTAETLNQGIELINSVLPGDERIAIRFRTPVNGHSSDRDFVRNYALNLELALADFGPVAIHDLSYHSSAILIRNDHHLLTQAYVRLLLDFETFVQTHHSEKLNSPEFKGVIEAAYSRAAKSIDSGTGNYGNVLKENYPFDALADLLNHHFLIPQHGNAMTLRNGFYRFFDQALGALNLGPRMAFRSLLQDFVVRTQIEDPDRFTLLERLSFFNEKKELKLGYDRIQRIREAAETLIDHDPNYNLSKLPKYHPEASP